MKNKKGVVMSTKLITIMILIISFVIILASFAMFGLRSRVDTEACRNSVVMRGMFDLPVIGGLTKSFISLKCKTQDVCFSMGAGCEEEVDETINIESKEELMGKLAKLLADCWWIMGEGKIDYGGKGDCAICYKVYFDGEIGNKIGTIESIQLYNYLKNNKVSNKDMNYLYYLYGTEDRSKFEIGAIITKVDKGYALVTSKQIPPVLVKFSSKDLGSEGLGCSKFVTEV